MIDRNPDGIGDKTLRDQGLTLMYPCFGQEKRISKLLSIWDAWSDDVKQHVSIILIDDYGTPSIESMLSDRPMDYNLSVYRILDDVKHNMPGAMNLGMMAASTPWLLTMDTDYAFQPDVMQTLLDFKPHQYEVYAFFQQRDPPDEVVDMNDRIHTNTFLIHKDTFTDLNGFDEDFSGKWSNKLLPLISSRMPAEFPKDVQGYGFHDNWFIWRFKSAGYRRICQRGYMATEWKDDPEVLSLENTKVNTRLNKGLIRAKQAGELPPGMDMLRFKWKKVLNNRRAV